MSESTKIAWCDASWNPVVGCSRVSEGCEHCYAERFAHRWRNIDGHALGGLTREGGGWNGTVRLNEKALELPLRWRKPKRIFVNSMSDLFHEKLSDEQIDRVFAVMALTPQHTFQILTKRPERMREYVGSPGRAVTVIAGAHSLAFDLDTTHGKRLPPSVERTDGAFTDRRPWYRLKGAAWPLPNVWLGVSVENQATADERIPLLLQTPAARRFVSYEPALGPVDFRQLRNTVGMAEGQTFIDALAGRCWVSNGSDYYDSTPADARLDWIIAGGESGPNARPCDVEWIRSVVEQCREAQVACFVKQLGAYAILDPRYDRAISGATRKLRARKGDDPTEWPEDLSVQEWPS